MSFYCYLYCFICFGEGGTVTIGSFLSYYIVANFSGCFLEGIYEAVGDFVDSFIGFSFIILRSFSSGCTFYWGDIGNYTLFISCCLGLTPIPIYLNYLCFFPFSDSSKFLLISNYFRLGLYAFLSSIGSTLGASDALGEVNLPILEETFSFCNS